MAGSETACVGEFSLADDTLLSPPIPDSGQTASPVALTFAAGLPLAVAACGGSSGGTSTSPTPTPTPVGTPLTPNQASRFLAQAAIGYSKADVSALASAPSGTTGMSNWINNQFNTARPQRFWDFLMANGYNVPANMNGQDGFDPMMWSQLMGSADMLRQRVGLALLSMWVVSIDGLTAGWRSFAMAAYLDVLWDNAFGNYRDILEGVSTSAAMGQYLTFLGSSKATAAGTIPDENYARELMQLFTIGLYQLNMDGSLALSGGQPVPTYTQTDVSQAARVWTGYVFANSDNTTPNRLQLPMAVNPNTHETGASTFLGISIPAGNDGATSRKLALDGLFNHANVPPFVSMQLIQHLVTSNPSPAYVGRVAAVFANNGSGVRGDMKAVIRAVLTDPEARDDAAALASTSFGKLREPVVRLVQWARAFNVTSPTKAWPFGDTSSSANRIGQSPGRAPSVFNWFRPGYIPPGTPIASANLVAPEFQVMSEPSLISYINYMQAVIANGAGEAKPDYASLTALATDSQKLLDELNLVLAAGQINPTALGQMKTALDTIPTTNGVNPRIYAAITLVMASPDYLVIR